MTRKQILGILVRQAQGNGFEFRKWFQTFIEPSWSEFDAAVELLAKGHRYYALLFAHDFAKTFWKQGSRMNFVVPAVSYTRRHNDGSIVNVSRKAYTRRTLKADVWKYHLREMAAQDEPLRYIRRFVVILEDTQEERSVAS